jgi:hypothetical protein
MTNDEMLRERVLQHCKRVGSCWVWTGCLMGRYPVLKMRTGRMVTVRRLAWQLWRGELGGRQVVCTCDEPRCVNPAHLELSERLASAGPPRTS